MVNDELDNFIISAFPALLRDADIFQIGKAKLFS